MGLLNDETAWIFIAVRGIHGPVNIDTELPAPELHRDDAGQMGGSGFFWTVAVGAELAADVVNWNRCFGFSDWARRDAGKDRLR